MHESNENEIIFLEHLQKLSKHGPDSHPIIVENEYFGLL